MNKRITLAALALAVSLATPIGAADWGSDGSSEPDTRYDTPTLMWANAPAPGEAKVYFNAYTTSSTALSQGVNPNLPTLQSQIEPFGQEQQWAVLGVWTDCNGDGYVGMAEGALREYASTVLETLAPGGPCAPVAAGPDNTATCWMKPEPAGSPCPSWPATGYNNYRGWVTELIPIGDEAATGGDKRVIKDPLASVWGDYGKPDEPANEAGGGTCAISPLPRGTMRSSGGLLTYADCRTGGLEVVNTVFADSHRIAGQDVPGAGDPAGLRFADDDDGTSNPTLGGVPTLGDEHSDNAIVHTGDCSSDPVVPSSMFPPGDLQTSDGIRAPDAGYLNPDGSVAGTVNYTMESAPLPMRQTSDDVGPESTSNCDFEDDRGSDAYLLEGDFNGVSNTNKIEADWNFGFQTATRGGVPFGTPLGLLSPLGISGSSAGPANDAGVPLLSGYAGEGPSQWFGGSTLTNKLPQTVTTRGTVAEGDLSADIDRGYWLSFYATVGGDYALTPGGTGTYGSTQCGVNEGGIHNGWNCDPAEWNLNPDGSDIPDPNDAFAFPGKVYNLRDVDCYDGEVGAAQLGVMPAFYGSGNCRAG